MNTIDKKYYETDNKIRLHLATDEQTEQQKNSYQQVHCGQRVNVPSTQHKAHPDVNEKIKSFLSFSAQQKS